MIKLSDILREVLEEKKADRCLRIARQKYDKPSAYRSGAIVRCRRGEIWKDLKEETSSIDIAIEKVDKLPKGKIFDDAKNIEGLFKKSQHSWSEVVDLFEKNKHKSKLQSVDIGSIHVTQPNIQSNKVKRIIKNLDQTPVINVVEFENGEKVIYDGHHRLIANWALGNTKIDVNLVQLSTNNGDWKDLKEDNSEKLIRYTKPNFKYEWEEAERYPEFVNIGKDEWIALANQGYVIRYSDIEHVLGNVDLDFDSLEDDKKERFKRAFSLGIIEHPIAVKFSDNDYDLVAGNTRVAGLVTQGIDPEVWVVDLSREVESLQEKESLHKWFNRKGGAGPAKGWVDCNTCREVDGKTKCKPCGRQKGEKRAKYPSCRPTPSACKDSGKGKTWGKTK